MKNKKMKHLQTFENYRIDESSWRSPLAVIAGTLFVATLGFISAVRRDSHQPKNGGGFGTRMKQSYNPKFAELKQHLDKLQMNIEDERLRDLSQRVESLMTMEGSRRMQDSVKQICIDLEGYIKTSAPELSEKYVITDSLERVINGDYKNVDQDIQSIKEIYESHSKYFSPVLLIVLILIILVLCMVHYFLVGTALDAFIGFDDRR